MSKPIAIALLTCLGLSACQLDLGSDDDGNRDKALNFDFEQTSHGWMAGFSDYPADNADSYELESGLKTLPTDSQKQGFMLSGMNRSDDLFMYIKGKVTGLEPSTRYIATLDMTFLSNAGEDCVGVGGAPGESVYVKFGFGENEPRQVDYYLNLDKGNQSNGGQNANVIGNVAAEHSDCSGEVFASKRLQTTSQNRLEFTSTAEGSIWLFIGTDSGYEGLTTVYIDSLGMALLRK
ncbi:hypothetical protein [Bowmanella dokdonensis]|uniref:Lipoprotein n=1 Tax=Bowmanella dokdonensis TaxID=751969 RepID=A0A939DQ82_9ALTE|nr:hypothetical protein [Bowmanella dokdonensis]MBN7826749.1 hypothetical protein [Bowmanella dokdonensis]